ncbi:MAG: thioredoxin domain-containing protein, partial [Alphaproteobacteria bacterium]
DVIYQRAINMMGQQGGWPLTIFLDPDGRPFWGGTYFPDQPRHGMPSFKNVLEQISNTFKTNPEAIAKNREGLMEGLERAWADEPKEDLKPSVFFGTVELIYQNMDPEVGGMQGAPKFPNMPLMMPFWSAGIRKNNNNYKLNFYKTMTMICQGGIYDHLGGGFCRYSTDAYWLAPHFEKMLYDNALIIEGLTEAWKEAKNPLYAARISETIGWLKREMKMKGGAFAASLDADSEGEEGKFYVWSLAEIEKVLGQDARPLIQHYGIEPGGNWEGKTILHRLYHSEEFDPANEKALAPLKTKLLKAREKRPRPFLDDKILADWNGLLISALVSAGLAFKKPEWIKLGEKAFKFILSTLQKDNSLHHSWREGKLGPKAYLDDYATMIRGATALYSATGKPEYLTAAEAWLEEAQENLEDKKAGGFYLSAKQKPALIARPKTIHDQATPSGNGLMIQNFSALYHLTGKAVYRDGAGALLDCFASSARSSPMASGTYFSGFDATRYGAHLFIKGQRSAKPVRALLAVLNDLSFPGLVVQVEEKTFPLPAAKALEGGQAIVCQGTTCSLPVESAKDLKNLLLELRQIKEK